MCCKRSRLRATVSIVVCPEVARDIAAAKHRCSYWAGEARLPARLAGENVLNPSSDKSILARLRYLRTLDTGAITATMSGG
jgi:hypothetical protein